MKMLHTGDWHIGKSIDGYDLLDDQRHYFDQFLDYVRENRPDVLLIAGDIYDRSVPSTEAVALLNHILTELILELSIPTILIAGNHDNSQRLGFANDILMHKGLYIYNRIEQITTPVKLEDAHGPVYFYAVPFIHPALARVHFEDEAIRSCDDVYRVIMEKLKTALDADHRNVLITHGYITGSETLEQSDSERRMTIGGSDYVDVRYFEPFDYVALGHLHGAQKVGHERIRYSGSPIKYSFSEVNQRKAMTWVQLDGEGGIELEQVSFRPLRDMRIIRGELNRLMSPEVYLLADVRDYIKAVLTDQGEVYDAMNTLRGVYPNIMRCEREKREDGAMDGEDVFKGKDVEAMEPADIFKSFFYSIQERELDDDQAAILERIIEQAKGEVEA